MKKNNYKGIKLRGSIFFTIILVFVSCNSLKNNKKNIEEYRRLRAVKLDIARPLIHNNDGDDHIYPLDYWKFIQGTESNSRMTMENIAVNQPEFSIENFLHIPTARSAGLVGTDVSTLSYCTSRSFFLFIHNTKIGECIGEYYSNFARQKSIVPELLKLGTDPLEVTCKFAQENGFEFFWSHRMNDTHDAAHSPENPHAQWNSFKEEHPEYLFGSIGERLPHGRWSAVDFSYPEIRDLTVEFINEVCENYDVDGIELDFFRHLYLFRNVARGEFATEEQLEMLTDMMTRIREMTEKVGMEKGKPILVLARVPDSFEYCRRVGIDLEGWMKRGLIDIVVGSGYFRLNPWEYLVKAGHKYGIKVYAGISESRISEEHPYFNRNQNAVYRARAAAAWAAGVDGIYSFNQFNTRKQYFREIGDPIKLTGTNNLYFVTYRNGNPNAYLKDGNKLTNIPIISPVNKRSIGSEPLEFTVEIGNESKPAEVFVVLYTKATDASNIEVLVNDVKSTFKNYNKEELIIFEVPQSAFKTGDNNIRVSGRGGSSKERSLLDMGVLFLRDNDDSELKELISFCL